MCTVLPPPGVKPTALNKYIISYHIIYHITSSESNRAPNVHVPRATMFFSLLQKLQYQILHIFNYHSVHEVLGSYTCSKMCYCYLERCLYGLICTFAGKSLKGCTCEEFVCRYDSVRMYRVVRTVTQRRGALSPSLVDVTHIGPCQGSSFLVKKKTTAKFQYMCRLSNTVMSQTFTLIPSNTVMSQTFTLIPSLL